MLYAPTATQAIVSTSLSKVSIMWTNTFVGQNLK